MRKTLLRKSLAYLLVFTLLLSVATMSFPATAQADEIAAAPVTADWNTTYQTMDGVGAAYAYTDSIMMQQLATAGHQDTVRHLLDLTFSDKNGTGHDICRVIIGDGAATASGTASSPGYNPKTGLLYGTTTAGAGYDIGGNKIPVRGTSGQYGYKVGAYNRIYDGQTDTIWPNEPDHEAGTLVPTVGFAWEDPSWNTPIANDDGGPTNQINKSTSGAPVIIKNTARTRKELFDMDQVWTMQQAMQYGVNTFYACAWEAPYWMSKGGNVPSKIIRNDVATIDGKTVKVYYQAYADYLVNYIKGYWEQWGIPITQINPFNEIDLAGADGSAAYVQEMIDQYIGPTLKKALQPGGTLYGIQNPDGKAIDFVPQLCAVDGCNLSGQLSRAGQTFAETSTASALGGNEYLDVFTTHLYGTVSIGTNETTLTHSGDFAVNPLDYTKDASKYPEYLKRYKLWETEFMNQDTADSSSGAYTQRYGNQNINDAVRYAYLMTNMFTSNPGFSAYLWWSMWDSNGVDGSDLIRFVHTNSQQNAGHVGTLTGEYRAFKRLYGFGHFSRFMEPGDVRFGVTRQPAANLNVVGFKSSDNKDFSITVTNANNNDSIQPLEFTLKDFPVGTTSVTVFRTSGSENQKKLASIPVRDGKFVIDIPSASIVTIVPSEGDYATYDGLESERDIFSTLEAEGNDNDVAGDAAGNAGRDNEAVMLGNNDYLAYKNVNFADGSANGGVDRRHLLYLTAQAQATSGGSILAYVLPVGTSVNSVIDILSKGTRVAEILVPGSTNYSKYQAMVDTGDKSAYGHKDLYIVAMPNGSGSLIKVDRFLFGANDSDWSSAANNSTVSIPGNVLTNGDFDTTTAASVSYWSTGRCDNGTFVQTTAAGASLSANEIQSYSGLSRYLKNSNTSKVAGSAKVSGRTSESGKYDGLLQDVTGKMTTGERYRFEGYFLSMQNGPLGYEIAADNPGDVEAALVYYDNNGNQLKTVDIGGRDMPEPYAAREAGERAWWNGNTLVGSILEGAPLGMSSFQPVDVKVADWHESDSDVFTYTQPEGTAKVVLALYAKDSNLFYADQLSIVPAPDRDGLRYALARYKGKNANLVDVVTAALNSSTLTQLTVGKLITALSTDFYADMSASLVSIKMDGTDLSGFSSDKYAYSAYYPVGGTPAITAVPFDSKATVVITPAASIPGQATITVTNRENQKSYTIDFTVDTALSGISVNGSPLVNFKPDVYDYTVRVPISITTVPAITATAKDPGVTVTTTQAAVVPGQAMVRVSYGSTQTIYTVNIENDSEFYSRLDPGPGKVPVKVTEPTNVWTARTPLDNRVPADFAGGTFRMIPYPFVDSAGKADVLQINYVHNGKSTFGGMSLQSPLSPAVDVPAGSTIEFDVYYPKSAQGKFMRWRVRNTSNNLDSYLRDYQYNNLNPDWIGSYNGETWLKAHHSIVASTGNSSTFILELHGENSRPAETGMLLVSDIKITQPDPNGVALPNVVNKENQSAVAPLKSLYNRENGLFMVGALGTGTVNGTRANHYEIFVDGNNLKAEPTHPRGPDWLKSVTGAALSGATNTPGTGEYSFPTGSYQAIRDSGTPGQYKIHGHVLAWYNQAPSWMRQIIPANLPSGYTGTANFYGLGNGVTTTVKVEKEMARRVQFNHTMYVMRHFLTTDTKYGSSVARGVIPFNSWDVLNEEVHESRHSELIPTDPNNWRTSLKHTNWLVAMSDDQIGGDIKDHYIYLLFKYAHIAAPNAKMAAAYKANYAELPEYMKLDGHDADGSIDSYIVDNPPKLTYNDYGIATRSKARTVYNMVKELNTVWLSDPLYDGRPLIEDVGIQGHDSVGKTLASDNQYAMALYASLIDQGLLSGISYSELDLKLPTSAPGGGATAPAALNVRQSDALGYEYALLYKLFTRFAPYIDHIISWGVSGEGWQGSYLLFDGQSNANAGYYGAMDPDRFILGHSYLDDYYSGEYEKLQDGSEIDLDDLGIYTPVNVKADLSGLTLSVGTLDPVFNAATTQYGVALKDVDSIKVTPVARNSKATIKVNGAAVGNRTASNAISLTPGTAKEIKVEVTAEDGSVKTYTINVTNGKTETPRNENSGTSSSTSPAPVTPIDPGQKVIIPSKVKDGTASVPTLDLEKAKEFFKKDVTIDIPAVQGVNAYSVGLPAASLTSGTKDDKLTLATELGKVEIPGNMLVGTAQSSGKEAALEIGKGDKSKLPAEVKAALGDRPIIQLTLTVDGKETAWSNPSAPVTVSVPYMPTAAELKNPEMIVVWYIDGSGKVVTVPSGRYDPKTGMVTFTTTHFSDYSVAYVSKTFTDLGTAAWAKKSVEVLASKDILKTEGNVFNPTTDITRADFLYSLVRTLGLTTRVNSNFSDVQKNAYYYNEIAIAKALGITTGIGNDRFGSDSKITRQDMMVLTERALKLAKKLNVQGASADLEKFSDKSKVASYAVNSVATMVKEGLITGSDNKVNPTGNTTKAEAAVFLYRIYNK